MFAAQQGQLVGDARRGQVGSAGDDDASRLAAGVRVNHFDGVGWRGHGMMFPGGFPVTRVTFRADLRPRRGSRLVAAGIISQRTVGGMRPAGLWGQGN